MVKKGYVYSIEMLIAMSIILVALVLTFKETPQEQNIEISLLKRYAIESLEYLDYNQSLREFVSAGNESDIENSLKSVLPGNVKFEIALCSLQCDESNIPKNQTVAIVDYYVSGYRNNFIGQKVKMWVWT